MDSLHEANVPEPFSCEQLRELHSDFLDGLLAPDEAAEVQTHLDECDVCARYDRVLRSGLNLVRHLPPPQPSDDFEQRLQHRLFHLHDATALQRRDPFAGIASTVVVAVVIALVAWSPLLLLEQTQPANDVALQVQQESNTMVPLPLVDPLGAALGEWFASHQTALLGSNNAVQPTIFPGPYSPLIVTPPVHGSTVRTVSAEFRVTE